MEIINIEDLRRIAAAAPYEPGHGPLLEALRKRYRSLDFNLIAVDGPWNRPGTAVVDQARNRINDDYKKWLTDELHATGDTALSLYERHKGSGMLVTEIEGDTAIITVPYSSDPDGFLQIQIQALREKAELLLFGHWLPPQSY